MKNKSLFSNLHLVFILLPIAYCLLPAFAFAQPAKSELPSIIKKIDIPYPASAAVDEKENRVFVMSASAEDSAVFVLNGADNSVIKKISIKPPDRFNNNSAGNNIAYNPDTKRLYASLNTRKNTKNMIAVIDAKKYEILSLIKEPRDDYRYVPLSINLSARHNMVYVAPVGSGYIFAFNGGSNKLAEEFQFGDRGNYSEISKDGDFLYIVNLGGNKLTKVDLKAKKASASLSFDYLPSVPLIDEKNGLIFVGEPYKLHIIDLKTFKLKDTREDMPVSQTAGFSIAVNPTTNHLFVPTYDNSVSVIDVPAMKIIATIKVGQTIRSIAVNSKTNRVYVTLVNEENKVVVIQDR